jgi:hypothetical protein
MARLCGWQIKTSSFLAGERQMLRQIPANQLEED